MMQDMPLVSVIIPTYNRADLLPRAIESVLAQTYRHIEIIVVDDGSTDSTQAVLQPFAGRIRYLSSDHRGTAHARNVGMRAATGKYVAFLDSDDLYLPNKLQLQVEFIEKHPQIGMVCTEFSGQHEDGRIQEYLLRSYHLIWDSKGWSYEDVFPVSGTFNSDCLKQPITYYAGKIFDQVLQDTLIPTNTILFDKQILEVVGYQNVDYRFAQEYEFVVRICKRYQVAFLNIPTYVLVFHQNQSTAFWMSRGGRSNQEVPLEIAASQVLINTVLDWGYSDRNYYDSHRSIVDRRLGDLYYFVGKKYLQCGDIVNARRSFRKSFSFKKNRLRLFVYWVLSLMPKGFIHRIVSLPAQHKACRKLA